MSLRLYVRNHGGCFLSEVVLELVYVATGFAHGNCHEQSVTLLSEVFYHENLAASELWISIAPPFTTYRSYPNSTQKRGLRTWQSLICRTWWHASGARIEQRLADEHL
eukprot:5235839-Amphidinium_carterae.1